MNDLISALRARFPDMDEAEAKAVAGAVMAVPVIADADARGAIREIAEPIACNGTRWDIEIAIARSAYAAGVKAERELIAAAIAYEASIDPCGEDANVMASIATLVRANFSHDEAEAIETAAIRGDRP